jgi:hypothetical protein
MAGQLETEFECVHLGRVNSGTRWDTSHGPGKDGPNLPDQYTTSTHSLFRKKCLFKMSIQ